MNYKIVLDPGHGGDDPGSSGNGIIEKDLNLKISKYIYDRLKDYNIPVTLTRTTDETLNPTDRVNRILNAYGNSNDVIVVSNHINAGGGDGAEVIYALRNSNALANRILNNMQDAGQNVRDAYQRRLPSDTSKDYYFIHRNTGKTQPIIVEYGFLDSTSDDVNQLKNNYESLAEAVVKSLVEYVGRDYATTSDNTYVVKSGDSLWSISKKYNIPVDELKRINNLTSNLLSIGQVLKIPGDNDDVEENKYTVKSGDTLYSIAREYNISVQGIKDANNLINNNLTIGQKLIIPTPTIESNDIVYTVKKGDNLYSIAKTYGLTQQELMNYNNLTSNLLSIGQTLKIPSNNTSSTYVVKSGDTLYSIARQFNTSVQDIKNKNNLTTNTLSIGQTLKI